MTGWALIYRILVLGSLIFTVAWSSEAIAAKRPKKVKKNSRPEAASSVTPPLNKPADTNTIIVGDREDEEDEDEQTLAPVERLFRNPVLSSGLSSGTDAINRSLAGLMESLFYNSMDNDFRHELTGSANIGLSLRRDVLQAEGGAWVVIDSLGMGPMYGKELYRFNDVPVTLGASQSTDVYDIYLRTDPMRVAETAKLPFWRTAVNNWFGVLPVLEAILPPSFNANELYDPLRRIESPFTFPLSLASFEGMETGTIKSYAINGGVNLGLGFADGIHGFKDQITEGDSGLEIKLPYTIFRTGQYRVNVFKRDINTAWVGITDTTRIGQRIETKIGKTYYLISKTIPYWKGLAAPFFPVDVSLEDAIADQFGKVYEFDLRKEEAQKAYLEAVHGNLAAAHLSWLRKSEDKLDTGIRFFYTKKEKRFEKLTKTGQNVFVYNKSTQRNHSEAELEITDKDGKYYILEARQDAEISKWDMLTGSSNATYSAVADLRVRKVIEKSPFGASDVTRYEFVAEANPMESVFTLRILDKFVETEEFKHYIESIGAFTGIDLWSEMPDIPIRDPNLQELQRRKNTFSTDVSTPRVLHTTPTHLGSFEGYASVHFTTEDLIQIAGRNNEDKWRIFCEAFEVSPERCLQWEGSLLARHIDRSGQLVALPLKLFDVKFARLDAINEIEDAMQALKAFLTNKDPEEKRRQLNRLFATEHPLELAKALLNLADVDGIARNVQLGANPKGNGPESAKNLFRSVNNRRFHRGPKTPDPARYDTTRDIESQFNPANLKFWGVKPRIRRLTLFREAADTRKGELIKEDVPNLSMRIYGSKIQDSKEVYVYVRLEQTGQLQLGKFKLAEQVFEIPLGESQVDFAAGTNNVLIRLSGPRSSMSSILLTEALALGGNFKATFAISPNGSLWSDERSVEFRIEDGKLLHKQ